jgi:hypothetical protein
MVCFIIWMLAAAVGHGGEFLLLVASGLESLPFLPLTILAYAGERSQTARTATIAYWFFLVGSLALMAFLVTLESLPRSLPAEEHLANPRMFLRSLLHLDLIFTGLQCYFGMALAVILGLSAFIPTVRKAAARVVPLNPDSFVHAVALATVLCLTLAAFVPLLVLRDPPLLLLASVMSEHESSGSSELRSTVYAFLWLVPATVVAVGYPIRRGFRQALARLGLVRPRIGHVLLAVLLVPALIGLNYVVDGALQWIWQRFEWRSTDERAFDELMKFAINPAGAIVIGVTAGLGEELSVRGVLQPRLGILLSNLFFTGLHALQYNWDGLLSVFVTGLALGILRKYTNTTTSALVHGGFDFVLVLAQAMQGQAT